MTQPAPVPTNGDEEDRLNDYLDALARPRDPRLPELDEGLRAAVHRIDTLRRSRPWSPDSADADRLWAELVTNAGLTNPGQTTLTGRDRIGIVAPMPLWFRAPSARGSLRLLSTVAAVLVLVAVALSVSQRLPRHSSTPTVMAADLAGSPAMSERPPAVAATHSVAGAAAPDAPSSIPTCQASAVVAEASAGVGDGEPLSTAGVPPARDEGPASRSPDSKRSATAVTCR